MQVSDYIETGFSTIEVFENGRTYPTEYLIALEDDARQELDMFLETSIYELANDLSDEVMLNYLNIDAIEEEIDTFYNEDTEYVLMQSDAELELKKEWILEFSDISTEHPDYMTLEDYLEENLDLRTEYLITERISEELKNPESWAEEFLHLEDYFNKDAWIQDAYDQVYNNELYGYMGNGSYNEVNLYDEEEDKTNTYIIIYR